MLYWRRRGEATPPRCSCQLRGLVDALSLVCDCPPPLSSLALVFLPRRALAGESRAVPSLPPGRLALRWQISGSLGGAVLLEDGSPALKSGLCINT